jgi:hypothetical protein
MYLETISKFDSVEKPEDVHVRAAGGAEEHEALGIHDLAAFTLR